ncbi:hypothetical protein H4219_005601 [Mycoemilia scoparia]|uniref:Uncharacterized protein n=1 Tax=Mycoemilia scoparia TaxID=417184 RepID=A0A9W7ZWX7_9FUNG|nr:hypothetical protein H4219_005601 [Mycoemilia scoparia]
MDPQITYKYKCIGCTYHQVCSHLSQLKICPQCNSRRYKLKHVQLLWKLTGISSGQDFKFEANIIPGQYPDYKTKVQAYPETNNNDGNSNTSNRIRIGRGYLNITIKGRGPYICTTNDIEAYNLNGKLECKLRANSGKVIRKSSQFKTDWIAAQPDNITTATFNGTNDDQESRDLRENINSNSSNNTTTPNHSNNHIYPTRNIEELTSGSSTLAPSTQPNDNILGDDTESTIIQSDDIINNNRDEIGSPIVSSMDVEFKD